VKKHRKDVPSELATIIERMLRKVPAERYQSAAEVATDLGGVPQLS
jgi:hypothetical protein